MCCQILKRKERKNIKDTMAHQILHPYLSISYLWLNNTATFYCYNDDIRSGSQKYTFTDYGLHKTCLWTRRDKFETMLQHLFRINNVFDTITIAIKVHKKLPTFKSFWWVKCYGNGSKQKTGTMDYVFMETHTI